jgi:ABC-type transport system involved in cytochrome bd biosynthesis fused ATPase/permease subunit
MQEFLSSPEQECPPEAGSLARSVAVHLQGTVTHIRDGPPVLRYVDFSAKHGDLVVIVGATGSGKSSLLDAVMGLTETMEDTVVSVEGPVAYVSQQAYIFGGVSHCSACFGCFLTL